MISIIIDDLERQHLINEEVFASEYFNSLLRKKKGLLKIRNDLARKGVKREIIELSKKVKKFEAGMVVNPVTIKPDQTLGDAFKLMEKYKTSKALTDEEYAKWFNDLLPALLENDRWRKNRNSRKIK